MADVAVARADAGAVYSCGDAAAGGLKIEIIDPDRFIKLLRGDRLRAGFTEQFFVDAPAAAQWTTGAGYQGCDAGAINSDPVSDRFEQWINRFSHWARNRRVHHK